MPEPLIRSISDTARWVAYHRATESDRRDAIFRDPRARSAASSTTTLGRSLFVPIFSTRPFRGLLSREPIEMVVNLAAGLDSRPYRIELPASLQWI